MALVNRHHKNMRTCKTCVSIRRYVMFWFNQQAARQHMAVHSLPPAAGWGRKMKRAASCGLKRGQFTKKEGREGGGK